MSEDQTDLVPIGGGTLQYIVGEESPVVRGAVIREGVIDPLVERLIRKNFFLKEECQRQLSSSNETNLRIDEIWLSDILYSLNQRIIELEGKVEELLNLKQNI